MLDQRQTYSDIKKLRNTPNAYFKQPQYQSIDPNEIYQDNRPPKMIARPNVRHEKLQSIQQEQNKLRQLSQQHERTKTLSNYRAFSINQRVPSNSKSQPDLIEDDSINESDFIFYRQRNISQNNISISYDNSQKKQSFLPQMNYQNKDPMLQTFGKQLIKPKRFPTEIFQGNVSKAKRQFQQNY